VPQKTNRLPNVWVGKGEKAGKSPPQHWRQCWHGKPIRSKAKQPAVTLLGELAGRPLELAGNSKPR